MCHKATKTMADLLACDTKSCVCIARIQGWCRLTLCSQNRSSLSDGVDTDLRCSFHIYI